MEGDRDLLERWRVGKLAHEDQDAFRTLLDDPGRMGNVIRCARFEATLTEALRRDADRRAFRRRLGTGVVGGGLAAALMVAAGAAWSLHRATTRTENQPVAGQPVPGTSLTAASEGATVMLDGGFSVRLASGSQYRHEGSVLILEHGAVTGDSGTGTSMGTIQAGSAVFACTGRVMVASDGAMASIRVAAGRVDAVRRTDGATMILGPGSALVVRSNGPLRDAGADRGGLVGLDERLAIFRLNGVSSTDGNPRGWNVPSIQHDLRDRRIWQAFTRSMTAEARRIIDRLRSERTTGVLVWDLEGRQGEHGLYVGQPDLLPELAPEMDAAADALFRTFMEAGLDTGILLRAERLVRGPRGDWTWDRSVDHGPTLAARAAYAHRRWGCSLFFINNSTLGDVPLAADALAAIRLAVPGARIILERAEPGAEGSATLWVPSPPGPAPTPADGARRAVWLPRQSAPGPDWDPRTDIPLIEVAGMDLGPLSP